MRVTVYLSVACAIVLAGAIPARATQQYTIAEHDTLYSIARRFGVSVDLLAEVNGIRNPGLIRVGAILVIPDPGPARGPHRASGPSSVQPTSVRPQAPSAYVVRRGDTLYSLARTFGVTVEALQQENGLVSPHQIRAGQVLRIPLPGASAPASSQAIQPKTTSTHLLLPVVHMNPPSGGEHRGPAPVTRETLIQRITATALEFMGTPYIWGGTSRSGIDCSGLVYTLYSPYVQDLPRGSYGQFEVGTSVDRKDLQSGDLVFFTTYAGGASHVGIYLGDGQFVSAVWGAHKVEVDRLDGPYWGDRYIGARRLL
jgi:cell wall-associated NlpC family hydrolase